MSTLGLILCMALAVYTLRLAGFLLAERKIPPTWERALGFVPIATLTALVAASLASRSDEAPVRLVAVAGAGIIAWRTGRAWACILIEQAKILDELHIEGLGRGIEELCARVDGVYLTAILEHHGGYVTANDRRGLKELDIELRTALATAC